MVFHRIMPLFLCLLVILISQATATVKPEYNYTYCFPKDFGYYPPNSTYQTNLNALLSRLTSNTQIDYGFYNSSYGDSNNEVYATGLCRGDVTPHTCQSCLNDLSSLLLNQCPKQMEAVGLYDKCILHYSYRAIYGYDSYEYASLFYYVPSDTNVTNWEQYNSVLMYLFSRLKKAAISDSHPNRKFAAGKATGTNSQTIYGVVQCSPDLTVAECNDCLDGAVSEIANYCYNKPGGAIIKLSCNLRYQNSRFYEPTTDELTLPLQFSPQPSPPAPSISANISHTTHHGNKISQAIIAEVVVTVACVGLLIFICIYLVVRKRTKHIESEVVNENIGESLQFDFDTIRIATNDFSDANKLGQGGFGPVYKGILFDKQEIAVKRLSDNSGQGDIEFKNEVLLMARLKHQNLVRLLGFCYERKERLLVYEFLPNRSLDYFLFDPIKRRELDWKMRYKIIEGIARGLLYLHEDSQLRIIHRDLKASNILLDAEMNPKISDFGLAKLFVVDQTHAVASKIAGTLGYMAPEYARHGKFSAKSDVFSFGVIILEIVSGQKNGRFHNGENVEHLLSFGWKNWKKGTISNIIDPTLNDDALRDEITRCIHIGLLCVQERVADRPTLALVMLMLDSHSFSLPVPLQPAFYMKARCLPDFHFSECSSVPSGSNELKGNSVEVSINEASISSMCPR